MIIREILPQDNLSIKAIITSCFKEYDLPITGSSLEDIDTKHMYQGFQQSRAVYYVVEGEGKILGGGGIKQLLGAGNHICELQKMYFLKQARGKALGEKMIDHCLNYAKEQGFEMCYLETLPYMKAAQKLYLKKGFEYIDGPMGSTGHTSCNVWLTKKL